MKREQGKKVLFKLILSMLIVIMLFQTIVPNTVHADDQTVGVQVRGAVFALLCMPLDAFMELLQSSLIGVKGDTVIELQETVIGFGSMVEEIADFAAGEIGGEAGKIVGGGIEIVGAIGAPFYTVGQVLSGNQTWDVPFILYSPELIFSGVVPLFNIDFFTGDGVEPMKFLGYTIDGTDSGEILHTVVQNWYKTLRLVSIVALLSILIYAGIKVVFSSISEQKAKYKEMLKDWIISLALVLTFHYIMIAVVGISKDISQALNNSNTFSLIQITIGSDSMGNVENVVIGGPGSTYSENETTVTSARYLGLSRFLAGEGEWAYLIIYLVLVIYTGWFSWIYLKRVLYIAFLTIIAPLVAFSYPLDKINDGSAEALTFWLREYIFNVMTQPMHLLIYRIVISSAFELAETNPIYALVAMGSVMAFEKVVRQILGFNKAQSAASLGEIAGTSALATSLINQLQRNSKTKKSTDAEQPEENKIRTQRKVDSEYKSRNPFKDGNINGMKKEGTDATGSGETKDTTLSRPENLFFGSDGTGAGEGQNKKVESHTVPPTESGAPPSNNEEAKTEQQPAADKETGDNPENKENNQTGEENKEMLRVGNLIVGNITAPQGGQGSGFKPKTFKQEDIANMLKETFGLDSVKAKALAGLTAKVLNSKLGQNIQAIAEQSMNNESFNALNGVTEDELEPVGEMEGDDDDSNPPPIPPTPPTPGTQTGGDGSDDINDQAMMSNASARMNSNAQPPQEAVGTNGTRSTRKEADDLFEYQQSSYSGASAGKSAGKQTKKAEIGDFWNRKRQLKSNITNSKRAARHEVRANRAKRSLACAKKNTGKAFQTVGRVPLMLALGTYGLAAAIVTGDPSKGAGIVAGGAFAGKALSDRLMNETEGLISARRAEMKEDQEVYERALYGEDYTQLENIRADEEFMKDDATDRKYKENFPMKSNESAIKYAIRIKKIKQRALEFRSRGITDDKVIAKAIKLQDKNKNNPNYQGSNIYDIASFAVQCPTNEEGMLAFRARLVSGYKRFFTEEESEAKVDVIMDAITEMRK